MLRRHSSRQTCLVHVEEANGDPPAAGAGSALVMLLSADSPTVALRYMNGLLFIVESRRERFATTT